MSKSPPRVHRSAATGRFVLNTDRAEKISAVEGMKLSGRMAAIVRNSDSGKFTGAEKRILIKEQFRKK